MRMRSCRAPLFPPSSTSVRRLFFLESPFSLSHSTLVESVSLPFLNHTDDNTPPDEKHMALFFSSGVR